MSTRALQPASRDPQDGTGESEPPAELGPLLRRRACVWRASRRALETCSGARAGLWLARVATVPFAVAGLYMARPLGELIDAVLAMALTTLSVFAVFAALSAAGAAHATALEQSRGLFVTRGIAMASVRNERWLGVATWVLVHLLPLALLVLAGCTTAPGSDALQLAGLALGVALYLGVLGAGLGALSQVCHALGHGRGQGLMLGFILLPQLVAPAWPELPTFIGIYSEFLDACLALGARV